MVTGQSRSRNKNSIFAVWYLNHRYLRSFHQLVTKGHEFFWWRITWSFRPGPWSKIPFSQCSDSRIPLKTKIRLKCHVRILAFVAPPPREIKFYGKNLQCLNENMADINAFEWIQSMIINLNILKMEINEIEMKPHFNFFFFFSSPLQGKR